MRIRTHGRGRRGVGLVALALLALVALGISASASADDSEGTASVSRFQRLDINALGLSDGKIASFVPASLSDKQVSVMLRLSGAPVAARGKLSPSQKAAVRADLKAAQDAMRKDVERAGATIVGQTQDAYNGILVHAKQRDLAALSQVRGVAAIEPVGLYAVPNNVNGVPLIGAPAVWGSSGNYTGQGVKVGIIDTGLDYTHADFGGPGTEAAFAAADAADTVAPAAGSYDPAKFKGGWDFAGDNYDAGVAGSVPVEDPNPLDCNGHGTHVAGTVAGYGVTGTGSTYTGSYDSTTVSGNSWTVGPGVAPKAELYSYRVFGCEGSTDLVILAINKAVTDGVDVINMSLGSPFGTSDQNDAELTAVNTAVQSGVTVIASAGNSGPSAYITGAPASANRALSVAAEDGSVATYPGGEFQGVTSGTPPANVKAINANGAAFTSLTAPVKVLRNADGSVSLGCSPSDYTGVTGTIAVVKRGTCARVARAVYGQKAGAVAVVMINNSPSLPPFEGKITSNPDTGEQYTVTIPFFGVKGTATSGADALALIAKDGQSVTVTPTTVPNTNYRATASFSSGGPRNGDSAAKPEITAPGVSVSSALSGGGTAATVLSGTSMAAPMTSGAAALVKQAHPTWTADQIKAGLVNTADAAGVAGYNGRLNGTGFLRVDRAVANDVVMTTADGLDSLSYGYTPSSSGSYTATKTFNVTNLGSATRSYNLGVSSNTGTAAVALSASSVTLVPGQTVPVTATLTLTPAEFALLGSASPGFGAISTFRGLVTATPTAGGERLRMQWLAAPRALSSITASAPAPFVKQQTNNVYTSSTTVTNAGIRNGGADFYAWGIKDAQDLAPNAGQDIRDAGVQSFDDGTIVFAVNGWNASSTQATQEYDVAIDLQNDKKADYFVVAVDLGAVTTGSFDGRVAAFLFDAKTGGLASSNVYVADAPMNGSTVLIPVAAADLGLKAANTSFSYWVNGFSIFGGAVDTTAAATYDTAKPGVSTGQFASLDPGKSATIPLAADYDKLQSAPALGWLVVNTDDLGGPASTEEIPLGALK